MKKILVVDDEIDILEPLSLILSSSNFQVETVSEGNKILSTVSKFKPDIILLDVLISGTDGREVCKELKKVKSTKDIPVLIISAHPGANKNAEESGADGFIAKPFDMEQLLTAINKALR